MERPSTSKPRGICKYYETPRGCFAGKNCKFLHGQDEKLTPYDKNKTCRYYRAGYCKRGDKCWFLHVDGSEESSPPDSDHAAECIICYDKPVIYGLMDGCSHVLCVQCIRQWRHPNNRTDDAETTNTSCPYCRLPSYFVTPSSQFFPKGHPRRAEIVAQYKASMARVPCRHFQNSPPNRRHCPFGRNCFYQHLDADGTPYVFPENSNPHRWIRARDLDDLSASLERLRRSIPEVFGNDAPQTEQQRRLVDLALDVGRTLTRFNFPQAEAFNPLGVLLAHHLAQHDESEPTTAEGTENNNPGADEPRPGVIDAILAPPVTLIAGEALQPEPADNVEQGSGSGDAGDGTVVRNSRPTEPTPPPGDVPIHSTRAGFAPGDLVFLTESFLDEGPTGTPEDQSPTINTVVGDQAEVVTSTQLNRSPEVDSPLQVGVPQLEGSEGHVELPEEWTLVTPPTPIYHDPHPPFETDGRGRVVWSNSNQQARLRSRSSPPLQRQKSSNDETSVTRDKEGDGVANPGIETEVRGNADGNDNDHRRGQATGMEDAMTGVH